MVLDFLNTTDEHVNNIHGGGVDWIGLAQHRNKWRALVNVVMSLRVPYNAGKFVEWLHN
jgi:hypothetical protein